MKNLGNMLKQAQEMQAKMQEMQAKLDAAEVSGSAGGGMVTVTLNGKGVMRQIKIDPKIVAPGDVEMLEDLILAAVNDARAKVDSHVKEEMTQVTGGLQWPAGMKLPF
jgi:DNA-binding YbaB/EbfC family protein